jgi:hypothetical protein
MSMPVCPRCASGNVCVTIRESETAWYPIGEDQEEDGTTYLILIDQAEDRTLFDTGDAELGCLDCKHQWGFPDGVEYDWSK